MILVLIVLYKSCLTIKSCEKLLSPLGFALSPLGFAYCILIIFLSLGKLVVPVTPKVPKSFLVLVTPVTLISVSFDGDENVTRVPAV